MKEQTRLFSVQLTTTEQKAFDRQARLAGTSKAGMLRTWLARAEAERKFKANGIKVKQ